MFTPMRYGALAAVGVGVLGLTGSIVFGLKAKDLQGQADEICPEAACNSQMAIDLNEDAQSAALKSNIFLGVGLAAIAGGVVLWFLGAPDDPVVYEDTGDDDAVSLRPVVDLDRVSLSLSGRF